MRSILNTSESRLLEINIYPDVTRDEINVVFGEECLQEVFVTLYNELGYLLKKVMVNTKQYVFDIHNLQSGYYVIVASMGKQYAAKRIFKQ